MVNQLPETDLLQTTTVWQRHSTGELLACRPGLPAECISDDIINTYHPLLAQAMHANVDWRVTTAARKHSIDRNTVLTILDLLHGEGFAFTDYYGHPHFLSSVSSLKLHHHGWVNLYGLAVNKHVVEAGGVSLPVVTNVTWSSQTVTREELEKRCPGWEARLKIGEALSLNDNNLARYVLNKSNSAEIANSLAAVSNVTFE